MAVIHLTKPTRVWINCVGAGVWASGVAWLIAHYLLRSQDAFGLPRNASEPVWLAIHGAFAYASVWTGGMLWALHVVKAWRARRHRISGATMFGALTVLIVSGYLLYYVADDRARSLISWIHWLVGLLLPVAYLIHRIKKSR